KPSVLLAESWDHLTVHPFLTASCTYRRQMIRLMGQALAKVAADNKISSVHVNFCVEEEREALEEVDFMPRSGLQFQWQNGGFNSFDDYLGSFRSDRRNKIKRERREVFQKGIVSRAVEGEEEAEKQLRQK